jgi:hypothetical protein
MLHGRGRLEPLEHLRQLPLEQLEVSNLLLDSVQLLRHEGVQSGTHGQTLPAVKLSRQHFELGEGEPECTRAANEQEPMDIVSGVLPVPSGTPAWRRQHADLLVVANGFCRYAGSVGELANRQRPFHSCSSLCDLCEKRYTFH